MKPRWALLLGCALAAPTLAGGQSAPQPPVTEVDPFIGVDGDGNTVPGAKAPFGFANPSPDTVPATEFRFDTSGYQSGKPVIGFSQTHVSGTGGEGKYGNFRIMPAVGALALPASPIALDEEAASPGYYRAALANGVTAELTATRLVAAHRYTFPATREARLILDAGSVIFTGGGDGRRQRPIATRVRIVSPTRIDGTGHFIGGWNPSPYTLHFAAEFSRPFARAGLWRDGEETPGTTVTGEQKPAGAWVTFDARRDRAVEVKVGLSFLSPEKAAENIRAEAAGADFDVIRRRAEAAWNDVLSKIEIDGGTADQRRIFTSALYRAHFMPHELTGETTLSNAPHYEDFYAIWDTFRTVHPLLTLIQPERQRDMLNALVAIYRQTGWLPDARVAGANGMMQGGTNADVLFADAWVKGLKGVDYATAYQAMVKNADVDSPRPAYEGRELGDYAELGYLSTAYERSASRTLEYAHNDFSIAQLAQGLCRPDDVRRFLHRSRRWAKLWNSETRSIRPRGADGAWMTPFDRTKLYMLDSPRFTWMSAPYYEGSAWQYSTYVPHDAAGLIAKLGGDAAAVRWLDDFFRPGEGRYAHNNEPDLLASFLYIHAGRPDRTQERVRAIMTRDYRTGRAGLPGNDDAGTISAWYVWNAIGLYPNAGQDFYYIGSPIFRRAAIDLGGGKRFTIRAGGSGIYVAAATLDGKPLDRAWLRHAEIARGGELMLTMSATPARWGASARPPSMTIAPPPPYCDQKRKRTPSE